LTVEQRDRERAGARAAVEDLAGDPDGGGSGLEAQVLAAQFVCAHAAAMDRQAEANRRDLPDHARATSQRLARQLMALTTSQIHALCRLRAERRKEREQAAKLAERESAAKAETRAAEGRALLADLERGLELVTEAGRPSPAPQAQVSPELDPAERADQARTIAQPAPLGAGLPEPPPDPPPPLNRRERRAVARLRRRARAREGVG
jgi:hypothetical protein